jgi:hypothetical protein
MVFPTTNFKLQTAKQIQNKKIPIWKLDFEEWDLFGILQFAVGIYFVVCRLSFEVHLYNPLFLI